MAPRARKAKFQSATACVICILPLLLRCKYDVVVAAMATNRPHSLIVVLFDHYCNNIIINCARLDIAMYN